MALMIEGEALQQARKSVEHIKFIAEFDTLKLGGRHEPVVRLLVPSHYYHKAVDLSFFEGFTFWVGMTYRESDDPDDVRYHHPKHHVDVGECRFESLHKKSGKDAVVTLHVINKTITREFKEKSTELEDKNVLVYFVLQTTDSPATEP